MQLAGDLDYFAKWFGAPRWSSHDKPCVLCRATFRGSHSWLDNRIGSPWQGPALSTHNWRTHWTSKNPLFKLPRFSSLCISTDCMRNMFLGWVQHLYGSILSLIARDILEEAPLQNLKYIAAYIKGSNKGTQRNTNTNSAFRSSPCFNPRRGSRDFVVGQLTCKDWMQRFRIFSVM